MRFNRLGNSPVISQAVFILQDGEHFVSRQALAR
jgi:hypothetical protein